MKKTYILLSFIMTYGYVTGQINLPDTVMTEHNDTMPGYSWRFSFVQLTDVHIGEGAPGGDYGSPGYDDTPPAGDVGDPAMRLRNYVRWINQNAAEHKIKFVVVTGDLTDSGEKSEFYKFKEIMDSLNIPYIPLIGNHDVWPYTASTESLTPVGDSIINTIFAAHFDTLKALFPAWNDGTRLTQIWNPEEMYYSYLQNFSFEYENYVFILCDFNTRKHAPIGEPGIGPEAQLMNFPGGTWQWLTQHLINYPNKAEKNIFLFSHHPAIKDIWASYFSFSYGEYDTITNFLDMYKDNLGIWFAGHIHRVKVYGISTWDLSSTVALGVETDANKEFTNGHFRIVNVWGSDSVVGVRDVAPHLSVIIYPNPNKGMFILEFPFLGETPRLNKTGKEGILLKISNILGQEIFSEIITITKSIHRKQLDLSPYSQGIYILQLASDEEIIRKKIIIE